MAAVRNLEAEVAGWEQEVSRLAARGVRSRPDKRVLEAAQDKLRAVQAEMSQTTRLDLRS
jgi:hypothetical protein